MQTGDEKEIAKVGCSSLQQREVCNIASWLSSCRGRERKRGSAFAASCVRDQLWFSRTALSPYPPPSPHSRHYTPYVKPQYGHTVLSIGYTTRWRARVMRNCQGKHLVFEGAEEFDTVVLESSLPVLVS